VETPSGVRPTIAYVYIDIEILSHTFRSLVAYNGFGLRACVARTCRRWTRGPTGSLFSAFMESQLPTEGRSL